MSIRNKYESELALVFNKLVKMCQATIAAIEQSVTALRMRDQALAKEVMANDREIDASERDIEQDCLKILLMEHPVAGDFREVSAALKMIRRRIFPNCRSNSARSGSSKNRSISC